MVTKCNILLLCVYAMISSGDSILYILILMCVLKYVYAFAYNVGYIEKIFLYQQ